MSKETVTLEISQESKDYIENETEYTLSKALEEKAHEMKASFIYGEEDDDGEQDNNHSVVYLPLDRFNDKQIRAASIVIEKAGSADSVEQLVDHVIVQNVYLSRGDCEKAVRKVLHSDMPVTEDDGVVKTQEIECDPFVSDIEPHMVDVQNLDTTSTSVRCDDYGYIQLGVCPECSSEVTGEDWWGR